MPTRNHTFKTELRAFGILLTKGVLAGAILGLWGVTLKLSLSPPYLGIVALITFPLVLLFVGRYVFGRKLRSFRAHRKP